MLSFAQDIWNLLLRDVGPLPVWAWSVVALLGYSMVRALIHAFYAYGRRVGWLIIAGMFTTGGLSATLIGYFRGFFNF